MLIVVYGYDYCPYTRKAAKLCKTSIIPASHLVESADLLPLYKEVKAARHSTIPMCFDMHKKKLRFIGGYDDVVVYLAKKKKPTK